MPIAIGSLVRVTDAVHGDHEPHEFTEHHQACTYVGCTASVAEVLLGEQDDAPTYVLDDCPGCEFFADELEVVG